MASRIKYLFGIIHFTFVWNVILLIFHTSLGLEQLGFLTQVDPDVLTSPLSVIFDDLVVLSGNPVQTIMQDSHLLLDCLVSPLAVQMEVLNRHETSHTAIKFLVAHLLERVGLEVRVLERSDLNLSEEHNEQVRVWELTLLGVLFEADTLSNDDIECQPRGNSGDSLDPIRSALGGGNIEDIFDTTFLFLLVNWAKEDWCLEDDKNCEHSQIVLAKARQHRHILCIE